MVWGECAAMTWHQLGVHGLTSWHSHLCYNLALILHLAMSLPPPAEKKRRLNELWNGAVSTSREAERVGNVLRERKKRLRTHVEAILDDARDEIAEVLAARFGRVGLRFDPTTKRMCIGTFFLTLKLEDEADVRRREDAQTAENMARQHALTHSAPIEFYCG